MTASVMSPPGFGACLGLLLALFLAIGDLCAQPAATNAPVRFRAVDIFVDSGETPLAAYQLEFAVTNVSANIIGIEGGEHPVFAQPPFYDPKGMQHERAIIAAFSTEAADKLPKGKTRVATIHIQTSGKTEPRFETTLQTAADANGGRIEVTANSVERKAQ